MTPKLFYFTFIILLQSLYLKAQIAEINFKEEQINKIGSYIATSFYLAGDNEHFNFVTKERKNFSTNQFVVYLFDKDLNHIATKSLDLTGNG